MSTEIVRARIDPGVKEKAMSVLSGMGLSMSDAIRMMLIRVAEEQAMPFQLRVPNAKTQQAMQAVQDGEIAEFTSVEDLFADLKDDEE